MVCPCQLLAAAKQVKRIKKKKVTTSKKKKWATARFAVKSTTKRRVKK
jgi:hypothetical protein